MRAEENWLFDTALITSGVEGPREGCCLLLGKFQILFFLIHLFFHAHTGILKLAGDGDFLD